MEPIFRVHDLSHNADWHVLAKRGCARVLAMQASHGDKFMKCTVFGFTLLLASGLAQAHTSVEGTRIGCDVDSKYSLSTYRSAFVFDQRGDTPRRIAIGGGKMFVDGREANLSASDHERVARIESQLRQMLPKVRQVTTEAIDIAFIALTEVARGLSNDPDATIANLESARRRARSDFDTKPLAVFNDNALAGVIKPIITEFVPDIVGGALSMGLKMAFSGEEKSKAFEARMERMEHELDRRVDARAKALEPLAESMCEDLKQIDRLDDALEFRLPDGRRLELLRVDVKKK